jgi:hypothetical protein
MRHFAPRIDQLLHTPFMSNETSFDGTKPKHLDDKSVCDVGPPEILNGTAARSVGGSQGLDPILSV